MSSKARTVAVLSRLSALGSAAAEMAFYFALSFVPFLALTAVAAVAWLPRDVGEPLAAALLRVFPREAGLDQSAIAGWVGTVRASGWVAAGGLLGAWSSFRFMSAGVRTLAALGGADRWELRHRLRSMLSALVLVFLWMLALLTTAFVVLVAPGLSETLRASGWIPGPKLTAATLVRGLAGVVLFLAVAITYRMIPGLGARGRRLWLVAALATCGWIAIAEGARRIVPLLWNGQSLYGALGSFVLFLLSCWADAWVILACGMLAGRPQRR